MALGAFQRHTAQATREMVVTDDAEAVPVGGAVRFSYPGDRDPALLLRLADDAYVAYSVVCTHLACEVLWQQDATELFCPCHNGVFDPVDGAPVAGPPERPLPRIRLERRGAAIVALGEDPRQFEPEAGDRGWTPAREDLIQRRTRASRPRAARHPADETDEGARAALTRPTRHGSRQRRTGRRTVRDRRRTVSSAADNTRRATRSVCILCVTSQADQVTSPEQLRVEPVGDPGPRWRVRAAVTGHDR